MPPRRQPMPRSRVVRAGASPDGVPVKRKPRKGASLAYRSARARSFARTEGCCAVCGLRAHHGHHRKRQSQGGPDTAENVMPVCWSCHDRIHRHDVRLAKRMGWLLHETAEISPWWELPFWTDRRAAA